MILNATVRENKTVKIEHEKTNFLNDVGATGEKNATVIQFSFPETICDNAISNYYQSVVFKNKNGAYSMDILNNKVSLPKEVTSCAVCVMQVVLKNSSNAAVEWLSIPVTLTFSESIADENAAEISNLLNDLIAIIRRTIGTNISEFISETEAKNIIETNLSTLTELKAAYWQLVGYVNQYQGTHFNSEYIEQVADVIRNMWDLGVQLTQSRSDVEQLRTALDRFMNTMTDSSDFSLDGELDIIIDEVGNEIDSIIAELEAERQKTEAVKAVYENFYLGGDNNAGNT